jgi:energy-coupling factor transport system ATP-binding protein
MPNASEPPPAHPVHPVALTAQGWGWRHATRKAWAVRGLDLRVEAGQRVLLLAPSGGGKSTLLAGLAGLLTAGDEEGQLLLDGVPARQARSEGVAAAAARTGLLLQDPSSHTVLARCGDDVAFGLENHAVPADEIWPRVRAALGAVQFPYPLDHPTARLSGGQRQRLALAGVLALRPGLLLLDEPTSMLDPDAARGLREQVGRMLDHTGATCLLVDHRIEPWLPYVHRVVVIHPGGGVVADGAPDEVFRRERDRLVAGGVWIPGPPPPTRVRSGPAPGSVGELLISARDLTLTRPGLTRPAVAGVDLDLRAGDALCLTGRNGAGKSTLAWALGGLRPPASGRLTAAPALAKGAGPCPHRWRPRQLVTRIGSVFQEPSHQFVAGTAGAELAVGPRRAGVPEPEIASRVGELLERLGLSALERANPFTLSGGEQRRLSVATMLATRPPLLVLDEPTFGLDARTWASLVDLLTELLDGGSCVVASTHDDALPAALAAAVLHLEQGVPETGSPEVAR